MASLSVRSVSDLWRLVAALAALAVVLGATVARAETRVALVIGNGAYVSAPPLDNPVNDATDMASALGDLGFQVLSGTDRTREQMEALLADFARAASTSDVALFYFAGHGFQVDGRNYLVPVDLRLDRIDKVVAQTVPLDDVMAALSGAPGLKLVFLDACSDNPLGIASSQIGRGLARVPTAAGSLVALATEPGKVAYDGQGRNGTYTAAILSHIRTPAQDLGEMMIAVRNDVRASTGGQQTPTEFSALTRSFQFNPGPPTASSETIFYQVASRSGDAGLMRLYLERYPDGAHVNDVLAMLEGASGGAGGTRRGLKEAGDDGEQLWDLAQRTQLRTLFDSYLELYPGGAHVAEARRLAAELPSDQDVGPARRCELLATHPRDRTERTPGVPFDLLARNATQAIQSCEQAMQNFPQQPKYAALLARAYAAAGLRDKAVALYRDASDRGDLRAMVSLALLMEAGDGVPRDEQGALALFEKAAAAGSADAAINLAVSLLEGGGGADAHARGVRLMQQASESGSAIATFNLGVLAQEGDFGSPADALPLFERAAREGETRGYRAAAVLLDEGRGVPRDPEAAAVQILLGVASDDGALLKEMTDAARNWSAATVAAVQARLTRAGLYEGPADGEPSPGLAEALTGWRNGGFDSTVLAG